MAANTLQPAHRDRLRVRPFEAGATVEATNLEKVPTPADLQWTSVFLPDR